MSTWAVAENLGRFKFATCWVDALTTFPSKAGAGIFLDSVRTDMMRGAWKPPRTSPAGRSSWPSEAGDRGRPDAAQEEPTEMG